MGFVIAVSPPQKPAMRPSRLCFIPAGRLVHLHRSPGEKCGLNSLAAPAIPRKRKGRTPKCPANHRVLQTTHFTPDLVALTIGAAIVELEAPRALAVHKS